MEKFNTIEQILDHMQNTTKQYSGIGWIQPTITLTGKNKKIGNYDIDIYCDRIDIYGKPITENELKYNIIQSLNEEIEETDTITETTIKRKKKDLFNTKDTDLNAPITLIFIYSAKDDPECKANLNKLQLKCINFNDFKNKLSGKL